MIHHRRRLQVVTLAALAFAAPPPAAAYAQQVAAQQDGGPRISLAEAVERLDTHNLEVRIAGAELEAARARVLAAGAARNPELLTTREQLSGGPGSYHESVVGLGQTLEIGGQRGLRRQTAEGYVEAAQWRLEDARQRLAFELHSTYVRAAAAEADLDAIRDALDLVRRAAEAGEARYAEGDLSRVERDRLRIEAARYEALHARTGLELNALARELSLLTQPEIAAAPAPLLPADRLPELVRLAAARTGDPESGTPAVSERPDVRVADAEVRAAERTAALQRRLRIPDVTLSGGYKTQADGHRGATISLSVPLPLRNRNAGGIAEADAALSAALARRELTVRRAEADVQRALDAVGVMEARARQVAAPPDSGPAAGLLEAARIAYAEGEMSLFELLDTADAYVAARTSNHALLADYLTAVYDLARATGRLIEPRPIATGHSR